MSDKLVIATVDTRNFTFTALGRDEVEAQNALLTTYATHAAQTGADPGLMYEIVMDGEVNFEHLALGEGVVR